MSRGGPGFLAAVAGAALLLAGCDAAPSAPAASGAAAHPADSEKQGKDRDYCRAVATEQMKTRRTVDYGRREVFAGQMDRYGTNALPDQMYDYGDTKNYDRLFNDCMASRGYPQKPESWWNKKWTF